METRDEARIAQERADRLDERAAWTGTETDREAAKDAADDARELREASERAEARRDAEEADRS